MNAQPSLPWPAPATDWEHIEARLRRSAPTEEGFAANVEVTSLLFDLVRGDGFEAQQFDVGRMPIGVGESVAYWVNAVLIRDQEIILPFFDHRRAKGLTQIARTFVFSMMREHLAARHPDLEARLAIFQFPQQGDERSIRLSMHEPCSGLLPFDALDAAVTETYAIWREVLEERSDEARKTGTDGLGLWG